MSTGNVEPRGVLYIAGLEPEPAVEPERPKLVKRGRPPGSPRRWRRLRRMLLGALVVVIIGVGAIRVARLWGLPAGAEPFDVAAFEAEKVAADRNAMVGFDRATAMLDGREIFLTRVLWTRGTPPRPMLGGEWNGATAEQRNWMIANRQALDVWRDATDLPDFSPLAKPTARSRPGSTPATVGRRRIQWNNVPVAVWSAWATAEASRLEDAGDLAGAWRWHKAVLRAALLCGRRGGMVERSATGNLFGTAATRAQAWADRRDMKPDLLRAAMRDVEAMDALIGRESDSLKRAYIDLVSDMNDPETMEALQNPTLVAGLAWLGPLVGSYQFAADFLSVEPERSKRLTRHLFANWLAEADRLPSLRAPIVATGPLVFGARPGAAAPSIAPATLAGHARSASHLNTALYRGAGPMSAGWMPTPDRWPVILGAERRARAELLVGLAGRLYELQTGQPAPTDASKLVGVVLEKLPAEFLENYSSLNIDDPLEAMPPNP